MRQFRSLAKAGGDWREGWAGLGQVASLKKPREEERRGDYEPERPVASTEYSDTPPDTVPVEQASQGTDWMAPGKQELERERERRRRRRRKKERKQERKKEDDRGASISRFWAFGFFPGPA
ncbi:hypothetical protein Mp_7g00120 [Marchantia polymorpha subsp. ruderalis]|uniref:Uncharacterized protein n=2 Tax=Marchantia polymorpha TaxID=3197 RepID=A0AAF6BUM1_MARPO|nr:hypothetical protein MARPO_0046s0112 [Marchantia polymorpha]BBN15705.1 hypothetical protein Mp_7g00120 [Marchantia polymorpha subsp. ruderalis]|eukprot:PTQ39302.1 hypothetical protein MARPO_0046s0112 [Marchantia polymorpha]